MQFYTSLYYYYLFVQDFPWFDRKLRCIVLSTEHISTVQYSEYSTVQYSTIQTD